MSPSTERKLTRIVDLYKRQERQAAKQAVCRLNRVELATLFVEWSRLPNHPYDPEWLVDFQRWILLALEGYE